jgi:hypothetical protein
MIATNNKNLVKVQLNKLDSRELDVRVPINKKQATKPVACFLFMGIYSNESYLIHIDSSEAGF